MSQVAATMLVLGSTWMTVCAALVVAMAIEIAMSRARVAAARHEERHRIERDLHDGAQQRLVCAGLQLRHLQHELAAQTEGAAAALDGVVDELARALAELRELAHGESPGELDGGLAAALRELAERAPLPVEIEAPAERLPGDLEAAAYFVASEGLTNAMKHARPSKVALAAKRRGGILVVSVGDDGVGGADSAAGSGLTGLTDRVEAHGGTLRLDSERGRGTTLTAELPCEAPVERYGADLHWARHSGASQPSAT